MTEQAISEIDWWSAYPPPRTAADRSHVRVNFISSADGSATLEGRSGALGGENDRTLMGVLRAQCDVLLVGAGTVRAEGYGGLNLSDELIARREALGLAPVPRVAVVSGSLDLTPDMPVFAQSDVRPIVVTRTAAPAPARERLEDVADVIVCGSIDTGLPQALDALRELGLTRVLCEGGPHLFGSLLELVDEVCLTLAPAFVGGTGGRITDTPAANPRSFRLAHHLSDAEDFLFLRYVRR